MILYHGSNVAIDEIDLSKSRPGKDFGKGFYLTSDLLQARSFVKSSVLKAKRHGAVAMDQEHGFISSFRFHLVDDGLKIHTFQEADREWLWFIAQNRRSKYAAALGSRFQTISDSDIIIGKVANDQTNPVITTYLNGLYGDIFSEEAIGDAIKRLMPEHLVDQYCFLTDKAIQCLKFQEARKYVG